MVKERIREQALALGFSAGLPLLLVLGTLSFRLREAGVDRTTIGFLSWVGLAYAFKWCWAPLVDRLPLPGLTRALGRRRAWLLLSQLVIMAALVGAFAAWFRAAGMARTMAGVAVMQLMVGSLIATAPITQAVPGASLKIMLFCVAFAGLWLVSAALFRAAAKRDR